MKKVILTLGGITILAILLASSVFAATSTTTSTDEEYKYTPNYSEEQKAEYSFQTVIINGSKYADSEGDDDYEYMILFNQNKL